MATKVKASGSLIERIRRTRSLVGLNTLISKLGRPLNRGAARVAREIQAKYEKASKNVA